MKSRFSRFTLVTGYPFKTKRRLCEKWVEAEYISVNKGGTALHTPFADANQQRAFFSEADGFYELEEGNQAHHCSRSRQ